MAETRMLNVVATSEDGDWFAFPADWSRREVVSELAHNMADWWLDEHPAVWVNDEDQLCGWVTAYRDLTSRIERGWVRYEPLADGTDWWWHTTEDFPSAEPAWVVNL